MRLVRQYILMAVILVVFGAFLIWPIVQVVKVGFTGFDGRGFTLAYVISIFQDHALRRGLLNSA